MAGTFRGRYGSHYITAMSIGLLMNIAGCYNMNIQPKKEFSGC